MSDSDSAQPKTAAPKTPHRRDLLRGAAIGAGATLVVGGLVVKGAHAISQGGGVKPVGFSRARPIRTDRDLPRQVDVAIIGGGYIGTATALALAERGVSVALFEKGVIAGESSGRSGGQVECVFEAPEKMELIDLARRQFPDLARNTGEPTGYMRCGVHVLFDKPEGAGFAEDWIRRTKGLPNGGARMLSSAEAMRLAPGTTAKLVGGITLPDDGTAEPTLVAPAMALGARKRGAKIYQYCAVRGIERTGGRVSGVVTERGTVKASTVVLAGGVWSPMMAHTLGLDLPTVQVFAKGISLQPFDGPTFGSTTISAQYDIGWRKQPDNGYVVWEFHGVAPLIPNAVKHIFDLMPAAEANAAAMHPRFNLSTFWRWVNPSSIPLDRPGPFEELRIYEPEQWTEAIDTGLRHVQEVMPVFYGGAVRERWTGAMEFSTDNMPIMSSVPEIPGLVLASGFSFGLTMGPGAGIAIADIVMGRKPPVDVTRYRYSRFAEGTHYTG